MNIKIEEFKIRSDDLQFILYEEKTYENGKHIGEKYETIIGYYAKLEHLINSLIMLKLKRSDITLLEDVKGELKRLREWIDGYFKRGGEI